jgi:hypothetical protein
MKGLFAFLNIPTNYPMGDGFDKSVTRCPRVWLKHPEGNFHEAVYYRGKRVSLARNEYSHCWSSGVVMIDQSVGQGRALSLSKLWQVGPGLWGPSRPCLQSSSEWQPATGWQVWRNQWKKYCFLMAETAARMSSVATASRTTEPQVPKLARVPLSPKQ